MPGGHATATSIVRVWISIARLMLRMYPPPSRDNSLHEMLHTEDSTGVNTELDDID